jgi:hypothetical protein
LFHRNITEIYHHTLFNIKIKVCQFENLLNYSFINGYTCIDQFLLLGNQSFNEQNQDEWMLFNLKIFNRFDSYSLYLMSSDKVFSLKRTERKYLTHKCNNEHIVFKKKKKHLMGLIEKSLNMTNIFRDDHRTNIKYSWSTVIDEEGKEKSFFFLLSFTFN